MFALSLCLAVLSLASSLELSQRPIIRPLRSTEPPYQPTQYTCRESIEPAVSAVCGLCGAETAYFVENSRLQAVRSLVDSDTYLFLLSTISDISARMPPSNYTIAGDISRLCISVTEVAGRPEFLDLFQYFGGMETAELAVPEIFDIKGETYFEYMSVAVIYQEAQLVYDAVEFLFSTSAKAEVTKNITLSLDRIKVNSLNRTYTVSYTGTTEMRGARVPFAIVAPFGRTAGSTFRANIAVNNAYSVRDWLTFTAPSSNCFVLPLPPGLSSVMSAPIQFSAFDFSYNAKKKKAGLRDIVMYFGVPAFAYAPGVFLERPTGEYQVMSGGECTLLLIGRVDLGFPIEATIISQGSSWYVSGGLLSPTITSITPRDIEVLLPSLYPITSQSLFPQYASTMVDLSGLLRDREIREPRVRFYYRDGVFLNVIGTVTWEKGKDAELQIMVGSVDDVIESVITIAEPPQSSTLPGDSDISTGDLTTVISTGYVNLTTYPYMTGERTTNVTDWLVGTYAFATISRPKVCTTAFCQLLSAATPKRSFYLSGNLIYGQLSLRGKFVNYQLAQGVQMYENDLVMEFDGTDPFLYIQGAFYLRSDSRSLNRFSANVTDVDGSAYLSARLENIWAFVFDLPSLFISSLSIEGYTKPEGFLDATAEGLAFLGPTCYTPWSGFNTNNCLFARVTLSLDPLDYTKNSMRLRVNSIKTTRFLNYIVGVDVYEQKEMPAALRGLDISNSVDILLTYSPDDRGNRVLVVGIVEYFGVEGWLQGRMTRLGSGSIGIAVDLSEFSLADENVFVGVDSQGRVRLLLNFDMREGTATGKIQAGITLWGVREDSIIEVGNKGARMSVAGRPFIGLYAVDVEIVSDTWVDLRTSSYRATGLLSEDDLQRVAWSVRQDLLYWIAQGTDALTTAMNWANNATALAAVAENEECEDRQCPVSPLCKDLPDTECIVYSEAQACDSGKPVCSTPEPTCSTYSEACIVITTTCSDTENDECITWDTECEETMNVCTEWTQVCDDQPVGSCGTYRVAEEQESCLEYRTSCDLEPRKDSSCVSACLQSKSQSDLADELSAKYATTLNRVNAQLSGFRTLNSLLPINNYNTYSVSSISIVTSLDTAGVGENDVEVRVVYQTLNLGSLQMETVETVINWDFQQEVLNEIRLFRAAKEYIVASRPTVLDTRLTTMTPFEVLLETFFKS